LVAFDGPGYVIVVAQPVVVVAVELIEGFAAAVSPESLMIQAFNQDSFGFLLGSVAVEVVGVVESDGSTRSSPDAPHAAMARTTMAKSPRVLFNGPHLVVDGSSSSGSMNVSTGHIKNIMIY
jgi:hypothetical protein